MYINNINFLYQFNFQMFKYQLLESKRNKNSKIWANTIILLNLNFIKLTNFFKKKIGFQNL